MYIRRRNYEHGRIKRNNRRNKSNESLHFIFGTYFKLLLAWASIIMLDFFTDLRFEFIWSCWLMVRTVNDSFRYQGLAFALFFTLTAIMADLLCYFLVPTTLIYLLGSSCVWIHLLWQTDRGVYIPTVALCFLFFYVEVAVRFRDPKSQPLGIDLCRPFAAHCIGYPVVTLGFSLKSMISHHFRLRRQKFVEAQNITFFSILEEALPKELWCYLKSDTIPKSKHSNMVCENNCSTLAISSPTSTVPNVTSSGNMSELNRVNPIHSRDKEIHPASSVNKKNMSLNHPRTTRLVYSSTRGDNCTDLSLCSNDSSVSQECTFRLGNDEPVNNHTSVPSSLSEQPDSYVAVSLAQTIIVKVPSVPNSVVPDTVSDDNHMERDTDMKEDKLVHKKSTSLLASVTSGLSTSTCSNSTSNNNRAKSNCTPSNSKSCETKQSPPSMNITSNKTTLSNNSNVSSPSSGAAASSRSNTCGSTSLSTGCKSGGKNANKDEYTLKLEAEARNLKSEIQSLRSSEIQLRGQVQQLLAAERTYRSESSQAQQESESLQAKLNQLTQRLQADRASLQAAEKRLTEERKYRLLLEQQFKQQSGKQIEASSSESTSNEPVISKTTDSKASMTESRSTSLNSCDPICVEACKNNELCAKRRQELELELQNLTKALTLKNNQLTALNSERFSHGGLSESNDKTWKKQTKNERTKQSNSVEQNYNMSKRRQKHEITETELSDLASRVNSLQEENQRLTDTLKEEDKMKQELMTAYHSSLKEITELNATLTKKEYQIVELNKRLNCLTPNLCEYVSRMNASTSNCAKVSNISIPLDGIPNEECVINSYSVTDTSQMYTNFNKTQIDEHNHIDRIVSKSGSTNRMNSYNQSYSLTPYETSAPLNNLSNQKSSIYFADRCAKSKPFFTSPFPVTDRKFHGISEINNSTNLNNLDYFGHLTSSEEVIPSSSSLTNTGLGYQTSLNDHCHINNRMHFRPDKLSNSNAFHLSHFETLGMKCMNGGYTSYDNAVLNRVLPTRSMPLCSTRPMTIGNSAQASSPPPLFVPPPGLLHGDIASSVLHYSHSINGTLSLPSLEVVANSSVCVTESMSTTPTAVSSYSPRIAPDSYSTDPVHTVGHQEDLSSQSYSSLNFNSSVCDNFTNLNPHSIFMTSNEPSCFQFGMRGSTDDKPNSFDFTTFGPVGSSSPAGTFIHSNLNSSNCNSSILSNLTSTGLQSRQVCLDSQNTDTLRFPMMSPSVSHSDAISNSSTM
ncbi:unnamed protein product [Schistosoma margrebowiei]|uniref:Macoilin n=2 Tax=Schistosoma margrebowiei TaxID=48269 RepID=A0AA85A9S9_9TREM|nr:unnamed protein product [Schistosoma margrebowiei]